MLKHHHVVLDLDSPKNGVYLHTDPNLVNDKIKSTGFDVQEPTSSSCCLLATIDGDGDDLFALVEIHLQDGQAHFKHWNLHPLREDWCLTHETNPAVQDISDAIYKAVLASGSTLKSLVRLMETAS